MASYSTAELEAYAADPDPNAVLGEGKTEEEKRREENILIMPPKSLAEEQAPLKGLTTEELLLWASEQVDLEEEEDEPTVDVSWVDEFSAAYTAAHRDTADWALWFESYGSLGDFRVDEDGEWHWDSARDLYGNDFEDTWTQEERLAYLMKRRDHEASLGFEDVYRKWEEEGEDTSAVMSGAILKALLSPTVLIPVGGKSTVLRMIGLGLLGGEMNLGQQLAEGTPIEDVDWGSFQEKFPYMKGVGPTAALSTVMGEAGIRAAPHIGKAVAAGGRKATSVVKPTWQMLRDRMAKNQGVRYREAADNLVRKVEEATARKVAAGEKVDQTTIYQELGLGVEDIKLMQNYGIRAPRIPTQEDAIAVVQALDQPVVYRAKLTKTLDEWVGPITTRIGLYSPKLKFDLRRADLATHLRMADNTNAVGAFLEKGTKLRNTEKFAELENALFNGKYDDAVALANAHFPDIAGELPRIRTVLDALHKDARAAGINVEYLKNYFPRRIKPGHLNQLLDDLGGGMSQRVHKGLGDEAVRLGLQRHQINLLDDDVVNDVVSGILSGAKKRQGKGGGFDPVSHRTIDDLPLELQLRHYESAPNALHRYVTQMSRDIERRKFFGPENIVRNPGLKTINIGATVRKFVESRAKSDNLSPDAVDDLAAMLQARFESEQRVMSAGWAKARDGQYMALLAHFDSAMIQMGDIGVSAYMNGMGRTIMSLFGKNKVSVEELGLLNKIAAEMNTTGGWNKAMDTTLRMSLFKGVDRWGKEALITASLKKYRALANTEKGVMRLRKDLQDVFGDEMDDVINSLQRGDMTDDVKLLLWNDLSDAQPITLSEMPQRYLEMPNGRIIYALKTFGLKQMDLVRRSIVQEAKKGGVENQARAMWRAVQYAFFVGGANASMQEVRHIFLTGELGVDDVSDKVFESLANIAFLSRYNRTKAVTQGKPMEMLADMLTPPVFNMTDEAVGSAIRDIRNDEWAATSRIVQRMPIFGKMTYNWLLGGAEKRLEWEKKEAAKRE